MRKNVVSMCLLIVKRGVNGVPFLLLSLFSALVNLEEFVNLPDEKAKCSYGSPLVVGLSEEVDKLMLVL